MNDPVLALRGVSKSFREGSHIRPVLDRFDLEIDSGGFHVLVGPSGSGKSTIFHLAGLLERPDQGQILHAGCSLEKASERERAGYRASHIGLVFQQLHLLSKRTAFQNVQFAFRYGPALADSAGRCREALSLVGLAERADQPVQTMSGGEQQRIAIARALVRRPRLLLADEPTGQLDEAAGKRVIDALVEATQQGIAVLLVTHRPELAPPGAVYTNLSPLAAIGAS